MKSLLLAIFAFTLAGCSSSQSSRNPTGDMASMTTCEKVAYALSDNRASAETRSVAREVGRNSGCFGKPQPQRVQIEQTVRVAN